ncbi:hypothetical protein PR003_g22239 [Phytophthora rubi]|uniref:Secreted protein n=1 Tax=Phytophthora rubi TaxID=129364 RepID=A0A6A3J2M5_9STRA|nr:hypothetical protein PR002_g21437 [Phytophthora rubi]KAE8992496.1 hypothetical protein PR001_g20921 [Phytophthora rubi]KAE9302517.1 hypothetical protein PR003_g22239 [Phytophthora rubi]
MYRLAGGLCGWAWCLSRHATVASVMCGQVEMWWTDVCSMPRHVDATLGSSWQAGRTSQRIVLIACKATWEVRVWYVSLYWYDSYLNKTVWLE